MSVQFGRWSFDGISPHRDFFERANTVLAPYGPDGADFYNQDGVGVLYRPFHTTKESRGETQPHVSKSGAVITWDGRLDNRAELIHLRLRTHERETESDKFFDPHLRRQLWDRDTGLTPHERQRFRCTLAAAFGPSTAASFRSTHFAGGTRDFFPRPGGTRDFFPASFGTTWFFRFCFGWGAGGRRADRSRFACTFARASRSTATAIIVLRTSMPRSI